MGEGPHLHRANINYPSQRLLLCAQLVSYKYFAFTWSAFAFSESSDKISVPFSDSKRGLKQQGFQNTATRTGHLLQQASSLQAHETKPAFTDTSTLCLFQRLTQKQLFGLFKN